ncbi:ArsA family ATPase [Actinomycetospora lutea]|uniref:ArsA family ATPase n=1 Tax=Actinomycetospora lutea TaxID=663604 RepID=UPI0023673FD6|nr:ArsA family ATPase [Actinomycetospora lutea]MDD7941739.1 ArsA family ATPase [Actinomycetospora lutea]
MADTTRPDTARSDTTRSDTTRSGRPRHLDLDGLLADRATRVLVCCGSGGVGKTTTAASLALRAAEQGRRVVVLTIDPARRLAQSLGLEELDNEPRTVPGALPPGAGDGELQAMMLDMRRTFDEMVSGHTTPDRAQAIFDNPFYQTISTSFSGTQEYMAMEKLGQLTATGDWDLVVVDTPPSRSALDFLDAPQRLSSFLDGRMIRLLSAPARAGGYAFRKIVGSTFNLFAKAVSTILGGQMLADASAFVQAFDTLFGGFQERANKTYQLLRAPGTQFVVVASPEPDALREASYFVERLSDEHMPLAGLVLNRTHPVHATLSGARAREAAETLEAAQDDRVGLPYRRGPQDASPPGAELAAAVLRLHADRVETAERERRVLGRFTRAHPTVPIVDVPAMATDVHDLEGLREIGRRLAS